MPGKARVHELARELGVESKAILSWLKTNGYFVKSASSTLEPPVSLRLRTAFAPSRATSSDDRIRVHQLAKELEIESRTLLYWLKDNGEFVKSASSRLEHSVASKVREAFPSNRAIVGQATPPQSAVIASRAPVVAEPVRHMSLQELVRDLGRSPAELVPWLRERGVDAARPGALIPAGDVREARRAFAAPGHLPPPRVNHPSAATPAGLDAPAPAAAAAPALATPVPAPTAKFTTAVMAGQQPTADQRGTSAPDPVDPQIPALDPALWREPAVALHASDPQSLGDYQLLGRLGHGGMGTVYRARRDGTVGDVALKTMQPHLYVDDEALRRFEREAKVLQRVGGTFTARVTDSGADHGRPFLVMELLDGLTLERAVELAGPLPAPIVEVVAVGLAAALSALHNQDIVHRDVKPSNLMITTAGLKVIDFGIARLAGGTQYTAMGGLLGTWAYMTPEQFTAPNRLTSAVDIFAWATTVLFALTGQPPYTGNAPVDYMQRILAGPPESLAKLPTGSLKDLLTAALVPAPQDRPSPQDLVHRLARGLTDTELREQSRRRLRAFLVPTVASSPSA